MSSFWKRHKHKIYAAAAIGAAGAGAVYYWWSTRQHDVLFGQRTSSTDRLLDTLQSIMHGEAPSSRSVRAGSSTSATSADDAAAEAAAALDASLDNHFQAIQELSSLHVLEDLPGRLKQVLLELTDYEQLRTELRRIAAEEAAAGSSGESADDASTGAGCSSAGGSRQGDKVMLWQLMARQCFTRSVAATWLVALLDLLVRLKLHIIGRHTYLEHKLRDAQQSAAVGGAGFMPFGSRPQLPPRLSERAQNMFVTSDYFVDVGSRALIAKMQAAVEQVLSSVDLGSNVGPADVEALVVAMHTNFESSFEMGQDSWARYLLPPPQDVPGFSQGGEGLMSPVEAQMVAELHAELAEVLQGYRFTEALRAAVRHTSRVTGTYVASKFLPSSRSAEGLAANAAAGSSDSGTPLLLVRSKPFAAVVPIVAKSCQPLFSEAKDCTKGISTLPAVQALCASVFTSTPRVV